MDIAKSADIMGKCCDYLENYRKTGFQQAIIEAKELADQLQIEPVFKPSKRIRRVKRNFNKLAKDEPIISAEKKSK